MQNRKVSMKGAAPRMRLPNMKKRLQLSGLPSTPFFSSATLKFPSLNEIQISYRMTIIYLKEIEQINCMYSLHTIHSLSTIFNSHFKPSISFIFTLRSTHIFHQNDARYTHPVPFKAPACFACYFLNLPGSGIFIDIAAPIDSGILPEPDGDRIGLTAGIRFWFPL